MSTDIELLPLPEGAAIGWTQAWGHDQMRAYARAVAEHNVKALRAELDNRWAQGVHTCHDNCQRIACVLRRENKRLAEALRDIRDYDPVGGDAWLGAVELLQKKAHTALRDHDQEVGNG